MHTMTVDELAQRPQQLLDDARRGEPSLVTRDGEPVLLALPLGEAGSRSYRVDLAATLFDRQQVSLGLAARIAGLGYGELIDELGRRGIATLRLEPGELDRELATGFGA